MKGLKLLLEVIARMLQTRVETRTILCGGGSGSKNNTKLFVTSITGFTGTTRL